MSLSIIPLTLKQANSYIAQYHRHNKPVVGHKFSIGCCEVSGEIHGVAIVGRPVARRLDDGLTVEVTRVCTDGTYNACSILYGACARIAKEMGYKRIVTYTLISEPGTSLKASGWMMAGNAGGRDWDVPSRPRETNQLTLFGEERKYPEEKKVRWEKIFKSKIEEGTQNGER